MKKIYTLFLIVFAITVKAQFNYQWAHSAGATNNSWPEFGQALATDASNNVYVAGVFNGLVNFGTGSSIMPLQGKGGKDIFLVKYDATGNSIFAKEIGGSDDETAYDIYVDANAIYIVGIFKGTCDFDPGAGTANLTYNGGGTDGDGFVAKYDLNGNYQWAFKLGSTANDRALAVTGDKNGDIIVSGFFSNTVDFDPGSGTANITIPANQYNTFFAKYTAAGNYVFAKHFAGDYSEANDVKTDANGDIFLIGDWSETVDVDPSSATVNIVTNSQLNFGVYMAKYSASNGSYIWHKTFGGNGINIGRQIAVNANAIYVAGVYTVTCDFDPGLGTANLTSNGGSDVFFGKYDLSGNYQFAKSVGGTTNDYLNGLDIDLLGNIFITGKFTGTNVNFSGGGIGTGSSLLTGNNTGYVAHYSSAGNFIAANAIGAGASEGKSIVVSGNSVYVTGSFQSTVDFDFGSGTANLTSNGNDDIFVARYNTGNNSVSEMYKSSLLIYPNPSNGIFTIETPESGRLEIYNVMGQLINSNFNLANKYTLDLSTNEKGIYFIKFISDKYLYQQQVIVK